VILAAHDPAAAGLLEAATAHNVAQPSHAPGPEAA
jgi:hypothetical protein